VLLVKYENEIGAWKSPILVYQNARCFFISAFKLFDANIGDVIILGEKSGNFVALYEKDFKRSKLFELNFDMTRIAHACGINALGSDYSPVSNSQFFCSDAEKSSSVILNMNIATTEEMDVEISFELTGKLHLLRPKSVIWSMAMLSFESQESIVATGNYYYVAGDDDGNVAVFQKNAAIEHSAAEVLSDYRCIHIFNHLHGKERVASICFFRDEYRNIKLVSCGRNGKIVFLNAEIHGSGTLLLCCFVLSH
jgi:hypothetical protein